jgi:hypothetical protein
MRVLPIMKGSMWFTNRASAFLSTTRDWSKELTMNNNYQVEV